MRSQIRGVDVRRAGAPGPGPDGPRPGGGRATDRGGGPALPRPGSGRRAHGRQTPCGRTHRPRRSIGTSTGSGTWWPPGAGVADGRAVADPERTHRRRESGAARAVGGSRPVQRAPPRTGGCTGVAGRHEVPAWPPCFGAVRGLRSLGLAPARPRPPRIRRRGGVQRQRHPPDDHGRLHRRRRGDRASRSAPPSRPRRSACCGSRCASWACPARGGRTQRHERDREEPP